MQTMHHTPHRSRFFHVFCAECSVSMFGQMATTATLWKSGKQHRAWDLLSRGPWNQTIFLFVFSFSWSSKSTAPAMGTRSIFEDPNCKENSNFMSDNVKVLAILQYGFEIILGFSLAYELSVGLCFWSEHTEKKSISYFALSGLFRRWKQMCSAHFHGRQVHSAVVHTWDQVANLGPYCKHTRLKCLKWALLQTAKFNRSWVLGSEYPSIPGAHQNWCGNTITTFDDRISSLNRLKNDALNN